MITKIRVAPPAWWFSVILFAAAAAQIGSYDAEYNGSNGESGGAPDKDSAT